MPLPIPPGLAAVLPSGFRGAAARLSRPGPLAVLVAVLAERYRFLASDREPLGPTVYRSSDRVFITGSYIKCLFLGAPPQGGLVTSIAWRGVPSRAQLAAAFDAVRCAGIFVLPMDAMEFGVLRRRSPGPFGEGFGFRLGLGTRPEAFSQALSELARAGGRIS